MHSAECLNVNVHVQHPSVRVLVVDLESGRFVEKRNAGDRVTSFHDKNLKHILPLMTKPFAYATTRSLTPRWEELLIFKESFSHLKVSKASKLGLFFLVQDHVSMNKANNSRRAGRGWLDVAWAFLKPFPSPKDDNTEKKLRLQLYKPNIRPASMVEDEGAIVWSWWSKHKHVKYPSTIFVTVQAIDPPTSNQQSGNNKTSGLALHTEVQEADKKNPNLLVAPKVPIWSRAPGQSCQIPRTEVARLDSAGGGVSCLQFSRDGRLLAAACPKISRDSVSNSGGSAIFIHDAVGGSWTRILTFGGHAGPIYTLDWRDSHTLLSASGDGTAQVWHLSRGQRDILEHPTFVYCARFHPNTAHVVVTGGYDRVLRVWKLQQADERYSVAQELTAHDNFVTALEFDTDGHNLFSGDRDGVIKIWEIFGSNTIEQFGSDPANLFFRLKKQLRLSETKGHAIENLCIHPGGHRLLVHSSSLVSAFVMVDLKLGGVIMQEFCADSCGGRWVGSCVTPCGSFVFAGGAAGDVHVFDTDTGEQKHVFMEAVSSPTKAVAASPVHTIAFHPHDHIVVFGALGRQGSPVCVYKYKKE